MTFVDNFISITDIRKKASFYINNIEKTGNKIIFVNNKPKAVLIDIKMYESLLNKSDIEFESILGSAEVLGSEEHENLLSLMRKA
ncbi:MAG: type II toxin-antitoxin system Phd/YefM family antitoxin [Candidatus Gracilibacteria bacterium]|nr:type II toxin-antitoxin system Phd/YefM family antitoxin [Candidatus Gracilibacteria bacterium]